MTHSLVLIQERMDPKTQGYGRAHQLNTLVCLKAVSATAVVVNTTRQFEICFLKPYYFHHFTKNKNTHCRMVQKISAFNLWSLWRRIWTNLGMQQWNPDICSMCRTSLQPKAGSVTSFQISCHWLQSTVWATANWFSSAVTLTGLPVIDASMTNPVNSNLSWCSQTAATLGVSDETALLNITWLHQHSPFHNTFLNTDSAPHIKFPAHCDNNMLHKTECRYNTDNHKTQRSYITDSTAINSSDMPQIAWLKYKRQSETPPVFHFILFASTTCENFIELHYMQVFLPHRSCTPSPAVTDAWHLQCPITVIIVPWLFYFQAQQVIIWLFEVRTVGWMRQQCPSKICDCLCGSQTCV